MTDLSTDSNDLTLRGPFLAAHRALRKAVDAHCAQSKAQSTVAILVLRECRGANNDARDKMLRDARISKELQTALAEFGGPEQIPLADGFAEYLGGRRRQVACL